MALSLVARRHAIWTVCLIMLAACGRPPDSSDGREGMASALPRAAEGWTAAGEVEQWDTESIFQYIDGHAEVYLAYGMTRCLSQRYAGPEGEPDIVVDLFELASPADAFGVFTHDRDGEEVAVGQGALYRSGWLSFWQGSWFGSIYVEGESEAARQAVMELGRQIAAAIGQPGEPPGLVEELPASGLDPRSVRFLRTQEILNSVTFVGFENPFNLGPEVEAVIGRYERESGAGWLLLVRYPDEAAAEAASGRAGAAGFAVRRIGSKLAAVLAPEPPEAAQSLLDDAAGGAK
jgi:hypothetical protein